MGPRNDDRQRFLRAFGLGFCQAGNHATDRAYEYDGHGWCIQHPCPSGPTEGPQPGYCQVGRVHFAKGGVWYIPSKDIWACHKHLAAILKEVIRRGHYGQA